MVDLLSNALNAIKVAELKGKSSCTVQASKLVYSVLSCLKDNGYLLAVEPVGGKLKIALNGSVNDCGSVRPRFFVKNAEWEKYENRFLPSRSVGLLIVSTPGGLLTHTQAKQRKLGGVLLAFVF